MILVFSSEFGDGNKGVVVVVVVVITIIVVVIIVVIIVVVGVGVGVGVVGGVVVVVFAWFCLLRDVLTLHRAKHFVNDNLYYGKSRHEARHVTKYAFLFFSLQEDLQ